MLIEWEGKRYQKESTHRSNIKGKKKNLLTFLQKCEKTCEKDTLADRWRMNHETIGIKKIKRRIRHITLGLSKSYVFPFWLKWLKGWGHHNFFPFGFFFPLIFLLASFSVQWGDSLASSSSSPFLFSSWLKGKIFVICFMNLRSNRLIINTWFSVFSGHREEKKRWLVKRWRDS